MRYLSYIFAVLILANIAAFLWPDSANYAPHVHAAKEEINPHFVRLNKEIEEKFYSQSVVDIEPSDATGSGLLIAAASNSAACYRIGPFMHKENYELAEAVLFNAGVKYRKSKRPSKSSNVYRVFLGPYDSRAGVADARVELKRKKVLDHFVRKQNDEQFIISLGIYSTEESADTAIRLFDGKLEGVQKQSEVVVLPDSYWLHFSMDEEERIRDQLSGMDWGEQSAKMGLHPCGA